MPAVNSQRLSGLVATARFKSEYPQQSLTRLEAALRRRNSPATVVTFRDVDDDADYGPNEGPIRIRWTCPVTSVFGDDCFAAWKDLSAAMREGWGSRDYDMTEDTTFRVMRGDKPLGYMERTFTTGGWRDLVDGQPIECGWSLEVLRWDGTWIRGRYEMGWSKPDVPTPLFYLNLWGAQACWEITEHMVVRRPPGSDVPQYPGLL